MRIRWSLAAADDLEQINSYLAEHQPGYRQRTITRLYAEVRSLKSTPHRGRPGRKDGTRELLVLPLPYILVYQVRELNVEVLRILHSSRDWDAAQ
ncbi:MAG: type II toxin-antitoxin system RelE/ParE family toxin [Acidobacteria bacterium]|nr:type II toxin-antitoxin system RelE/ParE family toxin [Acidobacteriota bacterium]